MGEPRYIVDAKQPGIYHPINWQRFGSYCGLSLNEQKIYLEEAPDDSDCCLDCLAAMPHVRKIVKRYRKIEITNDAEKDSGSDGEVSEPTCCCRGAEHGSGK